MWLNAKQFYHLFSSPCSSFHFNNIEWCDELKWNKKWLLPAERKWEWWKRMEWNGIKIRIWVKRILYNTRHSVDLTFNIKECFSSAINVDVYMYISVYIPIWKIRNRRTEKKVAGWIQFPNNNPILLKEEEKNVMEKKHRENNPTLLPYHWSTHLNIVELEWAKLL